MEALDKITALARGISETQGLELVDVEFFRAGRHPIVRIYIGKAAGVNVEDCARMSRELSALLDADDVLSGDNYTLEVTSPGLDRPLKTFADWRRNLGREVRITCRESVEGKIQHQGLLKEVDEKSALIESNGKQISIPLNQVALAKLEIKIL